MRREAPWIRYVALAVLALLSSACTGEDDPPQAEEPITGAATFQFRMQGVEGQDFLATTSNPAVIRQVRAQLQLPVEQRSRHVNGRLIFATHGGNLNWGWRFANDDWALEQASIELCDGTPEQVQRDMAYWLNTVGRFCPWGSYVVLETRESGAATGIIVKFTTPPTATELAERAASMQQIAQQSGLALTYEREASFGAHVLNLSWRVSPAQATDLARAISAQVPGIEYASPNLVFTPMG